MLPHFQFSIPDLIFWRQHRAQSLDGPSRNYSQLMEPQIPASPSKPKKVHHMHLPSFTQVHEKLYVYTKG